MTQFVRSYETELEVNLTISNHDANKTVAEVEIPSFNYNITLHWADIEYTIVDPITTSFASEILTTGLNSGESMMVYQQTPVITPNSSCPRIQLLCAVVLPATGASYRLSSFEHSRSCVNITSILNCDGKYMNHTNTNWAFTKYIYRDSCQRLQLFSESHRHFKRIQCEIHHWMARRHGGGVFAGHV